MNSNHEYTSLEFFLTIFSLSDGLYFAGFGTDFFGHETIGHAQLRDPDIFLYDFFINFLV